jgi:hypothetical protein
MTTITTPKIAPNEPLPLQSTPTVFYSPLPPIDPPKQSALTRLAKYFFDKSPAVLVVGALLYGYSTINKMDSRIDSIADTTNNRIASTTETFTEKLNTSSARFTGKSDTLTEKINNLSLRISSNEALWKSEMNLKSESITSKLIQHITEVDNSKTKAIDDKGNFLGAEIGKVGRAQDEHERKTNSRLEDFRREQEATFIKFTDKQQKQNISYLLGF